MADDGGSPTGRREGGPGTGKEGRDPPDPVVGNPFPGLASPEVEAEAGRQGAGAMAAADARQQCGEALVARANEGRWRRGMPEGR